jgi:hypothetical protein
VRGARDVGIRLDPSPSRNASDDSVLTQKAPAQAKARTGYSAIGTAAITFAAGSWWSLSQNATAVLEWLWWMSCPCAALPSYGDAWT